MKYENIVIATDADFDGLHISALLLTFFYKYANSYLLNGKISILKTPIVILYKGDNIYKFLFTLDELKEFEDSGKTKGVSYKYTKGLGSLSEKEWELLFQNFTFEDLLEHITIESEEDFHKLELWMNEDKEYRKDIIKEKISNFNIDAV